MPELETRRFIYYQEDDFWVGWPEDYPDYRSQGTTLDELRENPQEIYLELTSGRIPCVRRSAALVVG